MSQTHIRGHLEGDIGHLTLTNREKHNALPQSGWLDVSPVVQDLLARGARVIVVSGEGESFCAGADISEFDTVRKNAETARIYEASNVEAFGALRDCPVPTIAQIRGYCLGGGFGLAAACDLRLANDEATFAVPAAKLGLGYPIDALADIVDAVGTQNALHMLYTAQRFTASQMLEKGFLAAVTPDRELSDHVAKLAQNISVLAPLTHRATKATVRVRRSGDREAAQLASDATFTSADYAEGRAAFREKRLPQFNGD